MATIRTTKEILAKWCVEHMSTHTDWTGTRVETMNNCNSVDEFVDRLYDYLENNNWRC